MRDWSLPARWSTLDGGGTHVASLPPLRLPGGAWLGAPSVVQPMSKEHLGPQATFGGHSIL